MWLKTVSWRTWPGSLNTATESRLMHETIKLKMEYMYVACSRTSAQARACAKNNVVPSKSFENLNFDQKYLSLKVDSEKF